MHDLGLLRAFLFPQIEQQENGVDMAQHEKDNVRVSVLNRENAALRNQVLVQTLTINRLRGLSTAKQQIGKLASRIRLRRSNSSASSAASSNSAAADTAGDPNDVGGGDDGNEDNQQQQQDDGGGDGDGDADPKSQSVPSPSSSVPEFSVAADHFTVGDAVFLNTSSSGKHALQSTTTGTCLLYTSPSPRDRG